MQIYKAPIDEMRFLLEAFDYNQVHQFEAFEGFDIDTALALLDETGKFCTNELLPLNRSGDIDGIQWDPETKDITTAPGFKEAYKKFVENGLVGIGHSPKWGGSGAPHVVSMAINEMVTATNKSFSMCPGLGNGLIESLTAHGSKEQQDYFLPKLIGGEWASTMCLTEPHSGTDLGLMSTKAVPDGDHYKLTGTKIWITFGEHDFTDNIVHLVLARLPDAPAGIKGISVFIVPKVLEDGSRNGIDCTGIEHKMGIHASPTCVMSMENATGYLVGEPHKGMRVMFTMMNTARVGVGLEGVALGEIAYQTALEFAKDRRQSRSLDKEKRDPNAAADTIVVHPDVRRMLLTIKASTEALRGLAYYTAIQLDIAHHDPDASRREQASDLVALLTPIIKSYGTEKGHQNTNDAMQICGGAGYTTDWSIEQYVRDLRIALIYEGTNHIQALDLVGRKLPMAGGRLFQTFAGKITEFIARNKDNAAMAEFMGPIKDASKKLNAATLQLSARGMEDAEEAGASASNYLNLFALTSLAFIWGLQLEYATKKTGKQYETKFKTARFFFQQILPEIDSYVGKLAFTKDAMMDFDVEEF